MPHNLLTPFHEPVIAAPQHRRAPAGGGPRLASQSSRGASRLDVDGEEIQELQDANIKPTMSHQRNETETQAVLPKTVSPTRFGW